MHTIHTYIPYVGTSHTESEAGTVPHFNITNTIVVNKQTGQENCVQLDTIIANPYTGEYFYY